MSWHRSESTWLLELFEALAASGAPWPEGAAMQWLRYASDQKRDGKKAWSPLGQLKGIPGRPTLRRMWGEKAWSDRRVKNLLKLKTTTRHGVQIPAWEDPYHHERAYDEAQKRKKAQEEAEAELHERAQELADEQARATAAALEQERAEKEVLEARLQALEASLRSEAARMRPASGQDAARNPGASIQNHERGGQDAASERPESVHARLPHKTSTGPVDPPKAPQAADADEPHPPAPARGAGEPDPERAGVLLSEVRGAEERTVAGLAEHGVLTVDDLDRVYPCLSSIPRRPGPKAIERLRGAIADDRGWDSRVPEWRDQARDLRAAASRAQNPAERAELLSQAEELFWLVVRSCAVDDRRETLVKGFRAELAEVRSKRQALELGTPEERAARLLEAGDPEAPPWSYEDGRLGRDFAPWGQELTAAEEETHRALWRMGWEAFESGKQAREAAELDNDCDDESPQDAAARILAEHKARGDGMMPSAYIAGYRGADKPDGDQVELALWEAGRADLQELIALGVVKVDASDQDETQRQAYLEEVAGAAPVELVDVNCDDERPSRAPETPLRELPGLLGCHHRALERAGLRTVADWSARGAQVDLGRTGSLLTELLGPPEAPKAREGRGEPIDPIVRVLEALLQAYDDGFEAEFSDADDRRVAQTAISALGGPQGLAQLTPDQVPSLAWRLFGKLNPGQQMPGDRHAV